MAIILFLFPHSTQIASETVTISLNARLKLNHHHQPVRSKVIHMYGVTVAVLASTIHVVAGTRQKKTARYHAYAGRLTKQHCYLKYN